MRNKIQIAEKVLNKLWRRMEKCALCHRKCGVNRLKGEKGPCLAGKNAVVYSYFPHYGEEPALSGANGSGTVFFSGCSLKCVYCQNHKFSQSLAGREFSAEELSEAMIDLGSRGCHNINLVTPTHLVPPILEALRLAWKNGLDIPVVYNTSGYDAVDVIELLDGLVDVYLPDMRYSSDENSVKYSAAPGYVANNREVIREMFRQTGPLKLEKGIAVKGLIVRLLALPGGISGTEETLEFIAEEIGKDVHISLMSQYYPAHKAAGCDKIPRRITPDEYNKIAAKLHGLGLENGWIQPLEGDFDDKFAGENF